LEQPFSISFAPEATRELGEAVAYYEQLQQGLGKAFVKEIEAALALIKRWPKSCPVEFLHTRRLLVNRFPYKLLYRFENQQITILAVAHQHRAPLYWLHRGS
jgi:toxin ParE1/3/4